MNDCIFCKIIKGDIPSSTVYEDDLIKVIMNINPITNGHLLILPKKHYENILDIDPNIVSHSLEITKEKLYPLLKEKLNCEGLTILENNFLGQEIKHFHIHLIPRYQNDNAELNCNEDIIDKFENVYNILTN